MTVKTTWKDSFRSSGRKNCTKLSKLAVESVGQIALLIVLILRLNDGDLWICHWTDLAVNPVIHYVVIIKLKKHLYTGWDPEAGTCLDRNFCLQDWHGASNQGVYASMRPAQRGKGWRAFRLHPGSLHINPLQQNFLLPQSSNNMSVYHISDSTAISLWQVRWANKWQLIDLLLDISQEPQQ